MESKKMEPIPKMVDGPMIELKRIGGLKCDNPNCNYTNDEVSVDDYPNWVNCPCPLCGANLLTEEDYNATIELIETFNKINAFGKRHPVIAKLFGTKSKNYEEFSCKFNGTGNVKIVKK